MLDSRIEGKDVQSFFRSFSDKIRCLAGEERLLLDHARLYCFIEWEPEEAFEILNGTTVQFVIDNYGKRKIRDGFRIAKDDITLTAFSTKEDDRK